MTPLHKAALVGSAVFCQKLIDAKADLFFLELDFEEQGFVGLRGLRIRLIVNYC